MGIVANCLTNRLTKPFVRLSFFFFFFFFFSKVPKVYQKILKNLYLLLGNSKVKNQLINLLDLTQDGEGDLKLMCNLGEGLYEDGLMKGKLESALEMLKDGVDLDKVAKYTKLSLFIIKELAKQNKLI